jgi:hypothetical protein
MTKEVVKAEVPSLESSRLFKIIAKPTKDKDGNPIIYSTGNWFRPVRLVGNANN